MTKPQGPKQPPPPSPPQARQAFRETLLDPKGEFVATRHFTERMRERRFDLADVIQTARTGRIYNPPEWDTKHGEWTWRIEGKSLDGRAVYVVFSLLGKRRVKGITIETPKE